MRRVNDWCVGAPQYDDLTFVIVKVPSEANTLAVNQANEVSQASDVNELELLIG